jgi:glutathione synthase/RimK-type ligase-like ATP-grasp enzyme
MNKLRKKHLRSKLISYITQIDRSGKLREFLKLFIREKPVLPEERLESAEPVTFTWPENLNKPYVGLVKERIHRYASWPKFERFLQHNAIPYDYFNVHQSDFITQAQKFDLIIWHTRSTFAEQWEAKSKIEFLEEEMEVFCFPPSKALWFFEDKVRQHWLFEKHNIRAIKTFVSFSKEEALEYIKTCSYPIVSKEATNSGSEGVFLISNQKQALRFCNQVFGSGHKVHSTTYLRQKNYVLFQEFVPNDGYDLRITIIGNNYFGYYREIPPGDFRASGSGLVVKKNVPLDALYFAKSIKEELPYTPYLSVDLLRSKQDGQLYVIEISIFNRIRTSQQMDVDGIPGKYIFESGEFKFLPCQVWYQDLILVEVLNDWIRKHSL